MRQAEFEKFTELIGSIVGLETVQELDKRGYFTAPASSRFHGAKEGGLFLHSLHVAEILIWLTENNHLQWQRKESPVIVGLLHDLCKMDNYQIKEFDTDGNPVYEYSKNQTLIGHGDKSIIIAQQLGIMLTDEEIHCIRWHMGAFDDQENWKYFNNAIRKYNNVLWTHHGDMLASQVSEV